MILSHRLTQMKHRFFMESPLIKGGVPLRGAPVRASDLRAPAALAIVGLAAKGTTQVESRLSH
jgi:UDP-N-acetylglucosamine enolpyruvyl transferase